MQKLNENQNLKLYRMLSENAIFGILVFTGDGKSCIYANRLAKELIELSPSTDLKQIKIDNLFPSKIRPEFRAISQELFQNEGFFQDVMILKQNSTTFVANLGIQKINLDQAEYVALMFQDISIQKKLQRDITTKQIEIKSAFEELLKQNHQLKELDLAKNRFIALTTHELRTPLSAMVASAEILKLGLYDNETQRNEFVHMIYDQGHHLMELVNDILDFAKIQAGKTELFVEKLDLAKLAASLSDSFTSMSETSKVKVTYKKQTLANGECYYDEMRLRQVLSNIITNAIKYNREGGSVTIWLEEKENCMQLFVQDTGKGIALEDQQKVFDEFETLGKVALHHKGTGLGMPISKRLMEALGGKIELKSELGVGSTFWITLPKEKILSSEVYRSRPESIDDLVA